MLQLSRTGFVPFRFRRLPLPPCLQGDQDERALPNPVACILPVGSLDSAPRSAHTLRRISPEQIAWSSHTPLFSRFPANSRRFTMPASLLAVELFHLAASRSRLRGLLPCSGPSLAPAFPPGSRSSLLPWAFFVHALLSQSRAFSFKAHTLATSRPHRCARFIPAAVDALLTEVNPALGCRLSGVCAAPSPKRLC